MSAVLSVCGVRDLDGTFAKMAAVKQACDEAKIAYPQEVRDYFKYPEQSVDTLRQELAEIGLPNNAWQPLNEPEVDGFEVILAELPPEVKAIRFRVSY